MKLSGLTKVIYHVGEWIIRLVYANFLWIFFTLIGLGVFGLMPATAGLFSLLRQWIIGNQTETAFNIVWKTYRQEFIKSNLFGIIYLIIGFILRMDIIYFKTSSQLMFQVILIIMLGLGILFLITLLNFFPVYAHFEVSFFNYFKLAFLIGLSQLPSTIMMILGAGIIFCLYWYFSGLIPLFCVSLFCLNLMWFGHRSFKRIEYEQSKA